MECGHRVKLIKFAGGNLPQRLWAGASGSLCPSTVEDILCAHVLERLDHGDTIAWRSCYLKHNFPTITTTLEAEQLIERQRRRDIQYRLIFRWILRQNTMHLCTSRQPADDHLEDAERPWSTSILTGCASGCHPRLSDTYHTPPRGKMIRIVCRRADL